MDKDLLLFLKKFDVEDAAKPLEDIGAHTIRQLNELTDEEIELLKLKVVVKRRLKRSIAEIKGREIRLIVNWANLVVKALFLWDPQNVARKIKCSCGQQHPSSEACPRSGDSATPLEAAS
jgi:hypothetical protein